MTNAPPSPAEGWRAGVRASLSIVPTFVAIFAGFGVAAEVAGMPGWGALALTLTVFAAPAQFAMLELGGQGPAAIAQMIVAGVLVNLRFLLMSLALSHLFRGVARPRLLVTAQFVVASTYLLTFFRSRREPAVDLHAYFRGIGMTILPAAFVGTVIGLAIGQDLPPVLAFAATLFLPVYFALLLANETRGGRELAAVFGGLVCTPLVEHVLPGWGIFLAAVAVGAAVTAFDR
jgi:predicted branched-subunit amino acid permease